MKIILVALLFAFPFFVLGSIHSLDKSYFISPIEYKKGDIVIRSDSRGDGFFASPRSGRRAHKGIDLYASIGTPVLSVRSGIVVAATRNNGMGNYVIIKHAGNIISIYGHLQQIYVARGQRVKQGNIIGSVGKTGNARYSGIEPHLHFEIRKDGIPQDPLEYL